MSGVFLPPGVKFIRREEKMDEKNDSAGTPQSNAGQPPVSGKKIPAGVLGILLGSLGVHKFYLGYTTEGIIMLVLFLVSCGSVSSIIGLIEGIIYLCMTDENFDKTYVLNKKGWF
jgi:TM2 domain-containing membrane protein YozV